MNGSRQVYPDRLRCAPDGTRRFEVRDGLGEYELPDAKLTQTQKRSCRAPVEICFRRFSSHALMFLAGAFEDAANRKRAEEVSRT
jgi:hypothetical protein